MERDYSFLDEWMDEPPRRWAPVMGYMAGRTNLRRLWERFRALWNAEKEESGNLDG